MTCFLCGKDNATCTMKLGAGTFPVHEECGKEYIEEMLCFIDKAELRLKKRKKQGRIEEVE